MLEHPLFQEKRLARCQAQQFLKKPMLPPKPLQATITKQRSMTINCAKQKEACNNAATSRNFFKNEFTATKTQRKVLTSSSL